MPWGQLAVEGQLSYPANAIPVAAGYGRQHVFSTSTRQLSLGNLNGRYGMQPIQGLPGLSVEMRAPMREAAKYTHPRRFIL